jgi:hypothetical protein
MVYNGHIFSVATFDLTTIRTKFNPNQRCSIKMHVLLYFHKARVLLYFLAESDNIFMGTMSSFPSVAISAVAIQ